MYTTILFKIKAPSGSHSQVIVWVTLNLVMAKIILIDIQYMCCVCFFVCVCVF